MSTQLQTSENKDKVAFMEKLLGWVERTGNKVPNPVYLFLWFLASTFILSAVLNRLGLQVINPVDQQPVAIVNLINSQTISNFLVNAVNVFITFPPVGLVTVCTLGLGVATGSGMLQSTLKLAGMSKSYVLTTALIAFIGVNANLVGDAAFIIYPPLVALLFKGMKRNPLAGLFLAFASVSVGFGASLVVGSGDMSMAGMTEVAAQIIDPGYVASPALGWYFLAISCLLLTPVITWVNHRFVESKLDKTGLGRQSSGEESTDTNISTTLEPVESKGLKFALLSVVLYLGAIVLMCLPGMPFAAPEGGTILQGTLLKSIAILIFFLFMIPGFVYGKVVGTVKKFDDAIKMMTNEVKTLATFFVICFFAAQFISAFSISKIGLVIAISGGNILKAANIQGPLLVGAFVIMVAVINMFIGSGNAKWALLSSVFVPMFMFAGISPAATQVAYRMGDGLTNNITPTLPYLAIILGYAQTYDLRAKAGTVMAYMLPYSVVVGLFWIVALIAWLYLGLPVGPGYYGFM